MYMETSREDQVECCNYVDARRTLSTEVLKPAGSVEPPVLNGTLGSSLKVPDVSSPGLTGFWGCVLEDSWAARDDMVNLCGWIFWMIWFQTPLGLVNLEDEFQTFLSILQGWISVRCSCDDVVDQTS